MKNLSRYAPGALLVLRVVVGLLFFEHGTQKLLGFPKPASMPPAMTLFWFQGVIEVLGGFLLAIGLFTRPVAFILCGDMAVAYFMTFAPKSLYPTVNGGDAAVLFCFVFFYFIFAGPGPLSADETVRRR